MRTLLVATALVAALVAGPVFAQDAMMAPATTSAPSAMEAAPAKTTHHAHKKHAGKKHHHKKAAAPSAMAPGEMAPAAQ